MLPDGVPTLALVLENALLASRGRAAGQTLRASIRNSPAPRVPPGRIWPDAADSARASWLIELEAAVAARDAMIAAWRAQATAPGLPANDLVLPGGRPLPAYLLVAHYVQLLRDVRDMA